MANLADATSMLRLRHPALAVEDGRKRLMRGAIEVSGTAERPAVDPIERSASRSSASGDGEEREPSAQ